mgnify:CR=1 FL=1|tara:strand:- start:931 stop:1770 length:840 start_codon:yes stop_codon:yes gene_type:complete
MATLNGRRPWTFYALSLFFVLYVIFIYGPMFIVFLLSFQGQTGGLTFPMQSMSLHWYRELFSNASAGDIPGAIKRSLLLASVVMVVTLVISVLAGLAFRKPFRGSTTIFFITTASLIVPGILVGLGIGQLAFLVGVRAHWLTTGLGAQLTWTLPFGMLIIFAVFGRFDGILEEVASDLGATPWQRFTNVIVPILFPGMIAVALFGFTLSYDEFARSLLTAGADNTLPLEIWALMTNVTTPKLYAIGTLTTVTSLLVIIISMATIFLLLRKRNAGTKSSE